MNGFIRPIVPSTYLTESQRAVVRHARDLYQADDRSQLKLLLGECGVTPNRRALTGTLLNRVIEAVNNGADPWSDTDFTDWRGWLDASRALIQEAIAA